MPTNPASRLHPHVLPALILLAGLLATWLAYAPGLPGSLHFDDQHNLAGLATVEDRASAVRFIATGVAGPLGRPIALASFVPQAYAWPHSPDVFLHTNVLIHLLNGVLLTWFLYLLGHARQQSQRQAALVAAVAGGLWMLMPLLASSSLFIVQRMTTLSAVFVLGGAVAYMYARQATSQRPVLALFGMTFAVGAGVMLGALTKEIGALLPLFLLAMEATLLSRPTGISKPLWRGWFVVVLVVPLAMLASYLVSVLPYQEDVVLRRGFNGSDRLLTEAVILWKYLYLGFAPNPVGLAPFHDAHTIYRTPWHVAPALAVGAWLIVIAAAVALRRKAPLFSFAVAWYLLGHMLESTTLSLELYFEHRNYLPMVGPLYAVVASLLQLGRQWRKLAAIGLAAFALTFSGVLFSVTSLWGSPNLAAEMWHIYKPDSLRAVQHLAGRLQLQGDPFSARRVLRHFIEANPEAQSVRLQILLISCQVQPESDHRGEAEQIAKDLPQIDFNLSAATALEQLYQLASMKRCPGIDYPMVYKLGLSLTENPRFNAAIVQHNIHIVLARTAIEQRDFGRTMQHIEEALQIYHNSHTLTLAVGILNSGGRHDISWELLQDARARPLPRNPLRAKQWAEALNKLEAHLLSVESNSNSQSTQLTN
jgi:protein O-mannosyl-transferase